MINLQSLRYNKASLNALIVVFNPKIRVLIPLKSIAQGYIIRVSAEFMISAMKIEIPDMGDELSDSLVNLS